MSALRDAVEPTHEERVLAAARAIIERGYLRVAVKLTGGQRDPSRLALEEQETILFPWRDAIEHDVRLLGALFAQARQEGFTELHTILHEMPGIDGEMLDQAVEYARRGGMEPIS